MRRFLHFFASISLITFSAAAPIFAQEKPRQVILILADDLGWKDVGFNGSRYYHTPVLDSLASQSLAFTQAYANASNCAPSRACLMSGSYAPRHGVFTVSPPDRGDARTRQLVPSPNEKFLSADFKTLGKVFQEAGFKTAAMGKWHIGEDPTQQGFDVHKGGGSAGHHYFEDDAYELYDLENDPGERIDLETLETERREELTAVLNKWRTEVKAPIPTEQNPAYEPDFVPNPKKARK